MMDLQRCRILGKDGELYGVSGCIKTQIFIALGKEITGFVGDNEEIWNAVQET